MANYNKEIFDLEQVLGYLGRRVDFENEPRAPEILNTGLSYYHEYFKLTKKLKQTSAFAQDPGVTNYATFQKLVAPTQVNDIILFFRSLEEEPEEEKEKPKTPVKEDSTVPAELETLVALYKEEQANQLEVDTNHSVASAVIRARKTWATKHQADLIRENRLALIQDKSARDQQREMEDLERDLFLVQTVDPKAESAQALTRSLEKVSRQAVIAQAANLGIGLTEAQISKAVDDLTYLDLSGAIDPTNFQDLNIVSQLAFRNLEGITINSPINKLDDEVKAWQEASEKDLYSDKPDEIEKQINIFDGESQKYFSTATKSFQFRLKQNNIDLTDDLESAQKELLKAQSALLKAIPNAALPSAGPTPLHQNIQVLEKVLRQSDSSILINPEGLGARTIAVLQTTNSQNRNLSPEALRLYSLGLSPDKLDHLLKDPKSPLSQYFQTAPGKSIYQQVHFQLGKIHNSKLGREIKVGLKIPTGISGNINDLYNRLPPAAQTVTKLVLNPKGTVYAWVNKQIGERVGKQIIKKFGSATAQKLGSFVLKEGLKEGVKQFAGAAAKQLIIAAAKQAGIQGAKLAGMVAAESAIAAAAVALGISTFGLSLIIGAILMVVTAVVDVTIGIVKKGLDKVWQELGWGDKFRMRDLAAPLIVAAGAVVTAGAVAFGGFIFIVRTAQIAIISAVGIIIVAVVTVGLYLGFTYLVAPMLSTLVQLDSVEKVNYNSMPTTPNTPIPGCPSTWPVKGSFRISQGPGGKYSHYSALYSQAVDIAAPVGTPVYSTTDGVVSFAGMSAPYLNTKIVIVDTQLPNGTPFQVVYAHLSFIKVGQGQSVTVGSVIGASGIAGSGAHLHYEYKKIRYNQCPAGALQLAENCSSSQIPGAGKKCVPDAPGNFLYTN